MKKYGREKGRNVKGKREKVIMCLFSEERSYIIYIFSEIYSPTEFTVRRQGGPLDPRTPLPVRLWADILL